MAARLLKVEMQLPISRPPKIVYEAIVDPGQMKQYFISSGTARLDSAPAVTWRFDDVGAKLLITPKRIERNRRITFGWAASKVDTVVVIKLESHKKSGTLVKISESGWPGDSRGIAKCLGQTRGWAHMLSCMKAWLEYGVHLRKGGSIK